MIVLSAYALSGGYRHELQARLHGEATFLTLPVLRRLPPRQLLAELRRGHREHCVVAVEDDSSAGVLPILELVAAAMMPSRIEIAYPDLRIERVSRKRAAAAIVPVAATSAAAQRTLSRARRALRELLDEPRLPLADAAPFDRLLYLNPNLWFGLKAGGSVGHVAGVVNALADRGYEITLASAAEPIMIRENVDVVPLRPPVPLSLPVETNVFRFQEQLLADLEHIERPDVIYQRNAIGSYAGAILSRNLGVPLVLEYNGSEVWAAEHWGSGLRYGELAKQAEVASLRHAHLVVTISEVLADELRERGVAPERIVCHPNAVDPAVFDPDRLAGERAAVRRELQVGSEDIVITFVGTFGRWHGATRLAHAVARLADHDWARKRHVRFLFVGDGAEMPEVRETLREVQDLVVMTGLVPQAETPRLLAASDVFVSPHVPNPDGTAFFGSPTKLFEYMAMGKAIVASDLEQIGEILSDALRSDALPSAPPPPSASEVAVLVPPGDVGHLATSIRFAVDEPEWRAALGRNARRLALSRYTWDHHVAAIVDGVERVSRLRG